MVFFILFVNILVEFYFVSCCVMQCLILSYLILSYLKALCERIVEKITLGYDNNIFIRKVV